MALDLVPQATHTALVTAEQEEQGLAALVHVLGTGDLSKLSDRERVGHYVRLCRSLGLNELSRPFDWIFFKEKENEPARLALYANQSCTAQLRRQHHMRIQITRREMVGDLFCCEATAYTPDGRQDTSTKYVPVKGQRRDGSTYQLSGAMLANAYMKAETGAKRRVTLSMIGLASPPDADEAAAWKPAVIDGTGRILENPTEEQKALAADPKMARAIGEPVFEDFGDGEPIAVSQAVREEELLRPVRPNQGPTNFRADKPKWLRTWHALVKGTYLAEEPARRAYIEAYTSSWPVGAQTYSLGRFLDITTDVQAAELMQHTRHHLEERASAIAADPDGELDGMDGLTPEQADHEDARQRGGDARPRGAQGRYQQLFGDDEMGVDKPSTAPSGEVPERVHNAAVLTGAPVAPAGPERPDPARQYTRAELLALYDAWVVEMKRLDTAFKPAGVKRLSDEQLRQALLDLSAEAANVAEFLAMTDSDDEDAE